MTFRTAVGSAALIFGACATDPTTRTGNGALDYDGLMSALRGLGVRVEAGGRVEQPFFSVAGRFLRVDGEDVQVFEYRDAEAARAEAARVSPDGGSIGTSKPLWIAPPHFYRRDRLMVLYVGKTAAVRSALETTLGPQFAGN